MMKKFLFLLMNVIGLSLFAQPPNNDIFNGGNNDGSNKNAFFQAGNNIFNGGTNDGWSAVAFTQTAANIFQGGVGDGWSAVAFKQASGNIFSGGDGDGWGKINFLQAGNAIFAGGDGDGWSQTKYLEPGNSIFNGGIGDGWAYTYLPAGPLPVKFLYFAAKKQSSSSAMLNWETTEETNAAYYDVERSTDAVLFSKIGSVKIIGNSSTVKTYQFTDNNPAPGFNYYRLRQVDHDGKYIFTPARMVNFSNIDAALVKYFPNPTQGILTIQLPVTNTQQEIQITISNVTGVVMKQQRLSIITGNTALLNMSQFARGVYFIQVRSGELNSTQRVILQ